MELSPELILASVEEKAQVSKRLSKRFALDPKSKLSLSRTQHAQVLQFMVEEKLPKEVEAKRLELQIYEDVINERNINAQYLSNLQDQVRFRPFG